MDGLVHCGFLLGVGFEWVYDSSNLKLGNKLCVVLWGWILGWRGDWIFFSDGGVWCGNGRLVLVGWEKIRNFA